MRSENKTEMQKVDYLEEKYVLAWFSNIRCVYQRVVIPRM